MAGRYEQALQVFERAHRLRLLSKTIPHVVRGPELDPIRADPRFKAILVDMGLPDITEDEEHSCSLGLRRVTDYRS